MSDPIKFAIGMADGSKFYIESLEFARNRNIWFQTNWYFSKEDDKLRDMVDPRRNYDNVTINGAQITWVVKIKEKTDANTVPNNADDQTVAVQGDAY